jgi:hypothetical protein
VDEDHAARVEADGIAEELTDPDERRRHVTDVDGRDPQHDVLRVEQHDAQLLAFETSHLEDESVCDVPGRSHGPAGRRPVREQPATELEGGCELRGAHPPDAGDRLELTVGRAGEAGEAVVKGQGLLRDVERRSATRARAPQQRDELGSGEPAGAAQQQPLAGPLGIR